MELGVRVSSLLLVFLLGAKITCGQNFPYNFQTWDKKSGLPSDFCNTVCEDENGHIYVGTSKGLAYFNGYRFSVLFYPGREPMLGEGNVEDMIIDSYNRLWFASTVYGLGLIHLNNLQEGVRYFKPKTNLLQPYNSTEVTLKANKLCFDTNGDLWMGTYGNGLFKFDTAFKSFTLLSFQNPSSEYSLHIKSLMLHKPDSMFVGIVNGLCLLNPSTGKISYLKTRMATGNQLVRPSVRNVKHYTKDSFFLATDRGTYILALSKGTLVPIFKDLSKKVNLAEVNSNDIHQLTGGEKWVATENDGIFFINASGKSFYQSWQLSMFNRGVPKGLVSQFYKDKRDNIWIAHQHGMSLFQSVGIRFYSFSFEQGGIPSGLMASDGNKLIFAKSQSIASIDPANNTTETQVIQTLKKMHNPQGYVISGKLDYLMFYNDSFFLVNKATNHSKLLPVDRSHVDSSIFRHFVVNKAICDTIDGEQQYLLSASVSAKNVLLTYSPNTGKLQYFSSGNYFKDPLENRYTNIEKASPGKYWVSTTNKGLLYIDVAQPGNNTMYNTFQEGKRKISTNHVSDFVLDNSGNIWALLFNVGLAHVKILSKDSVNIRVYDQENGLTDARVTRMIRDDNNNIWIVSNSGICCFETRSRQFLQYNPTSNIAYHSGTVSMAKTSNGFIAITDNRHYELLWFKQDITNFKDASLIINSVKVNDEPVWFSDLESKTFPAWQNSIAFNFDIIDYDKKRNYKILYKLDGYDKNWLVAGQTTSLQYRQLPGGRYTFRMKLKYTDGSYSPEASKQFAIKTVWYKTLLFKIAMLLFTIALVYMFGLAVIRRKLAKQKAVLELQQALLLERNRISAELHDDLGGGLSTIKLMSEMKKDPGLGMGDNYLEAISTKAKELIQNMNEIVWSLNNDNDNLPGMVSYIRQYSKQFLDERKIDLIFNEPELIPECEVQGKARRHIFLLIKEALHNIVKHSQASEVVIHISISEFFVLSVNDNGAGMATGNCTTGNGLKNMKQRMVQLKGSMEIKNDHGTTIIFSIPVQSFNTTLA